MDRVVIRDHVHNETYHGVLLNSRHKWKKSAQEDCRNFSSFLWYHCLVEAPEGRLPFNEKYIRTPVCWGKWERPHCGFEQIETKRHRIRSVVWAKNCISQIVLVLWLLLMFALMFDGSGFDVAQCTSIVNTSPSLCLHFTSNLAVKK